MKKVIKKIFSLFIRVDNKKIILLEETPFSGSNCYAFYNYLVKIKNYKNVEIIDIRNMIKKEKGIKGISQYFSNFKKLSEAGIVITDHAVPVLTSKNVIIQLFHGIPLKSMALIDKSEDSRNNEGFMKNINAFTVTSDFSAVLENACIGLDVKKYQVLGNPRNDLLYTDGKEILKGFLNIDISDKRIIVYMPTFKKGYIDRQEGTNKEKNIFSFENFNMVKFNKHLKDNNIIFIVKLHPYEEKYYKQKIESINSKNIFILETDYLVKEKADVYKFLAASDMLITDYSSVFLDYLLTQKPVIFNNVDIEMYRKVRGILLEPYDFWTPGPKINNQQGLQEEMLRLLNDPDYYSAERKKLLDIFHKYHDNKSCERIWEHISQNYL